MSRPNPFADLATGFHFAHAVGPDGPCTLLIQWDAWTKAATILDDGARRDCPAVASDGRWWLHKWQVFRVDPMLRPDFDLSLLTEVL